MRPLPRLRYRAGRGSAYLTHCHTLVDLEAYKFLVVDELPMTTLADRLTGGSLSAKEATRIVCQAALALTRFGEYHQRMEPCGRRRIWLPSAGAVRLATFPLVRDPLAVVGCARLRSTSSRPGSIIVRRNARWASRQRHSAMSTA